MVLLFPPASSDPVVPEHRDSYFSSRLHWKPPRIRHKVYLAELLTPLLDSDLRVSIESDSLVDMVYLLNQTDEVRGLTIHRVCYNE